MTGTHQSVYRAVQLRELDALPVPLEAARAAAAPGDA
jgi:hypothetical protein